jgi:hypothetical protein
VAWLISVTRTSSPSTRKGGFDGTTSETKRGGRCGPAGELPSDETEEATHLRGVRIEKALPIKMLRKRGTLFANEESGFTSFDKFLEYSLGEPA